MASKLESEYQSQLKKLLEDILPGCVVLVKPGFALIGFPDLLVLYKNQWAALEVKRSDNEPYQPGQEWWLDALADVGGFSAMICPENQKETIDEILRSFGEIR